MHARNPYKANPPDFCALAKLYPTFAVHVHNGKIQFNDPAALVSLTKTLLLHDFGIVWEIPCTRLCPAIPNRINYLLWVEDLISMHRQHGSSEGTVPHPLPLAAQGGKAAVQESTHPSQIPTFSNVQGIDIGTGASVIFPLLGCRMNKDWSFVATEIDDESVSFARRNVDRNGLRNRIHILKQGKDDPLLSQALGLSVDEHAKGKEDGIEKSSQHTEVNSPVPATAPRSSHEAQFDFLMCNPPFFDLDHQLPQHTATGISATHSETVCEGGEVGFVTRMAKESACAPKQIVWYTSMLGKRTSLPPLKRMLREIGVTSILHTQLVQGKTMRWAIAWSFVHTAGKDNLRCKFSSGSATVSNAPKRDFHVNGQSPMEIRRRLEEYVKEENSRQGSDHSDMQLSPLESTSKDVMAFLICSALPKLHLHVGITGPQQEKEAGVHINLEVLVAEAPISLLDRTMSRIERDLKRSGRYWRRRRKRRRLDAGGSSQYL